MKSNELKRAIAVCTGVQQPCNITGSPGIGKSKIAAAAFKALNYRMLDKRTSIMEPGDMGIPMIVDGKMKMSIPDWLPTPSDPPTALFLDELSQATPMMQNALSELIYDRTLGGADHYTLPESAVVFAAGNRKADRAATHEMPSHIRNRFLHLELEVDVDDWTRWAFEPDATLPLIMPPKPADDAPMDNRIIAFIKFRGKDMLDNFKATENISPTPRSWSFVNKILPHIINDEALQYEMVKGCVGDGAASEFIGYLRLITAMPDPDLIFTKPNEAPIPEETGIKYALMVALAARVTKKTNDALFTYLNRADFKPHVDFAVMCARDAIARDKLILQCKEGVKWATANAKTMF